MPNLLFALLLLAISAPLQARAEDELTVRPLRGFRAEAATWLMRGEEAANLSAVLEIEAPVRRENTVELSFAIEIPLVELAGVELDSEAPTDQTDLTQAKADAQQTLEIYCYVVDPQGAVVGHLSEEIRLPDDRPRSAGLRYASSFRFELSSDLATASVRLLALEPEQRLFAMAVRDLDVATASPSPLPRPTVATESGWLRAVGGTPELHSRSEWLSRHALRPVLLEGPVQMLIARASSILPTVSGSPPTLTLRANVPQQDRATGIDPTSQEPLTLEATWLENPTRGAPWQSDSDKGLQLTLPVLDTGPYEVTLNTSRPSGPALQSAPRTVWFLASDDADSVRSVAEKSDVDSVTWLDVLGWQRELGAEAERLQLTSVEQVAPARDLQKAYVEALSDLSSHWTLERVAADITSAEARASAAGLEPVGVERVELAVARPRAAARPEAAVALLAIHAECYRRVRAQNRYADAGRHRRTTLALARTLAEASDEGVRERAAEALAAMSLTISSYGLWPGAEEQLKAAVKVSPASDVAHALLARLLERRGDVQGALEHSSKALGLNANLEQTQLRYAVLLLRRGRSARAETELASLVAREPSEEVSVVAHQELAKLLMLDGRDGEACTLLGRASKRLERADELSVLTSVCRNRSGQRGGSRERAPSPSEQRSTQPSSRLLYGEVPQSLKDSLAERVAQAFQLYVSALSDGPSSQAGK